MKLRTWLPRLTFSSLTPPLAGSSVQIFSERSPPVAIRYSVVSRPLMLFFRPPQHTHVVVSMFGRLETMQPLVRSHTTILLSPLTPTVSMKRSSSVIETCMTPWSCSCIR